MRFVGRKQTMTVKELYALLGYYADDAPVLATWEGVHAPIIPVNFALKDIDGVTCLVMDVEDY